MTDPAFGPELRRLRTAAGVSLAELAARVHYSKGYLSKVETGLAQPNHTLATLCDVELDTGGALFAVVPKQRRKRGRPSAPAARPVGLPTDGTHFTGRTKEVAEIRSVLLADQPDVPTICAIDGMAGVGKTALALHVAHLVEGHFPDGSLFLDLQGYTPDTQEVASSAALDRFLRLLGVPGEEIPSEVDDRAALYRGCLKGLRLLVVLDNVSSAQQIRPLLPGERSCRVLVTSRSRLLALDDAHHLSLDVLSDTEAAALFGSVAGSGRLGTEPDAARWVSTVVERCGRLPLAVRIAAARWRGNPALTLPALSTRLQEATARLHELDDGERSVTAAFQLSYRGLAADQRRLLGLLALHPGADIDAPAAGALGGLDIGNVTHLLDRLQDSHLLAQLPGDRYRFHDLLRVFAQTTASRELSAADRTEAVLRLVDHGLHGIESVDRLLAPHRYRPDITYDHLPPTRLDFPDADAALSWAQAEWPNLVALCRLAADRGLYQRCWQLAYLLRGFFFLTKLIDPWIETHTLALAAARQDGNRWAQAVTVNNLGIARLDHGDFDIALSHHQEALNIYGEIGDEHGQMDARANMGWTHHYSGADKSAFAELGTALEFYQRIGVPRKVAITLRGIALTEIELGAYADAVAHATEAEEMLAALGLDFDTTMALNCLGWAHFRFGHHDEAAAAYHRAVEIGERAGSPHEVARAETGLGNVAAAQDRLDAAQRHWDRAQDRYPGLNATVVGESRARLAVNREG
jgi:tetratricopeptide (TPR) repeat protein